MGFNLFTGDIENLWSGGRVIINTINPHSYAVAQSDKLFSKALKTADIIVPDGIGICFAAKFIYGKKIKPITGSDLHEFYLEKMQKEGGKVFYLGSSMSTLRAIEKKINKQYPNINVATYSPPFKINFSATDNLEIQKQINVFSPDVLFVGMTAPKQEKWVLENANLLHFGTVISIGAVFDYYSGAVQRPAYFWRKLGLEWLIRLLQEPRRLWKRSFVSLPYFLTDVVKYRLGIMKKE